MIVFFASGAGFDGGGCLNYDVSEFENVVAPYKETYSGRPTVCRASQKFVWVCEMFLLWAVSYVMKVFADHGPSYR